jgi:hypothetical protein
VGQIYGKGAGYWLLVTGSSNLKIYCGIVDAIKEVTDLR